MPKKKASKAKPVKKSVKKTSVKSNVKKTVTSKKVEPQLNWWQKLKQAGVGGWNFFAVLLLFSAFSLYALGSYFNSTNNYIDGFYVSVVDSERETTDGANEIDGTRNEAVVGDELFVDEQPVNYEIFTDVSSDSPYAEALESLRDQGVIEGFIDGSFKPDDNLNRAELMVILTTAADADFSGRTYDRCFKDVQQEWYAVFVCYAKDKGWISGYEDGSFRPGQLVTKAEALKIILVTFGFEVPSSVNEAPFADVPATVWYAPSAAFAKEKGIVNTDNVNFNPAHELTRAEFAQMVYSAMKVRGLI